MGRRKIEIRAIKDDRNRSVTFLKRKGGLFKKAHELSVLCSVDVAVIIFGHNKKLYQFSSGDIKDTIRRWQLNGPPHEHKGPSDFKNKGSAGDDDDEDDEEDNNSISREDSVPPQLPHHPSVIPPHLPQQNSFQHIRSQVPSASPPMTGGMFGRPINSSQPPHMDSRPSSRNAIRKISSTLVPLQPPQATPPPPSNGFAYSPNPSIYNPQPNPAPPQPSPRQSYQQFPQRQQPHQLPHQQSQQQPHQHQPYQHQHLQPHQQPQPPPQHYTSEPRTQTPPQSTPRISPPPSQQQQQQQQQQHEFRQPEVTPTQSNKGPNHKSQSIYTPIDEDGSVLALRFFGAPDPPRHPDGIKTEHSPENNRRPARTAPMLPASRPTPPHPRPSSSLNKEFRPPQRSDTNNSSKSGGRPKLNLQIPSEAEDGESTSNSPGPRSAVNSANPVRLNNGNGEHHNLILPPPSPSASAVLSAGASGPPNPFARPPPPTSQNNNAYTDNRSNNLETPISALPSRYMDPELIASPGGLFGSWANFGGSGAILPSPNVNIPLGDRTLPGGLGRGEKRDADESLNGDGKRIKI